MAPIKRIAHSNTPDTVKPLNELIAIRNSMQLAQQSLSRLERLFKEDSRRSNRSPSSISSRTGTSRQSSDMQRPSAGSQIITPRRKLINNI